MGEIKGRIFFCAILSAASGLMWLAAFCVPGLGWFMWLALAPLWVALLRYCNSWRLAFAALVVAVETGVGGYFMCLAWKWWMALVALLVPLPLAVLCSLLWLAIRRAPLKLTIPAFAAFAASLDLLVSKTPAVTVASLSVTQADIPFLLAPAGLLGFSFITFLTVLAGGLLALPFLEARSGESRLRAACFFGAVLAVSLIVSNMPRERGPVVQVAAIEAGRATGGINPEWPPLPGPIRGPLPAGVADYYAVQTMEAAKEAELVVWPEAFMTSDPLTDIKLKRGIEESVDSMNTVLVVTFRSGGMNLAVPVFPGRGFDTQYEKHYPAAVVGEKALVGEAEPVYEAEWGKFGLLICYDMHYEDVARRLASRGAQLLAVSSNSMRRVNALYWMRKTAQIRAVENNVAVVLSDTYGATAIISPEGRVIRATTGIPGYIAAEVSPGSSWTFYNRVGHILRWGFPAVLVAILFLTFVSRRKNAI